MYERLRIQNFRGLRDLTLVGLRRVNLLVGENNCGKSSVLEALHVLASEGSIVPLMSALARRGEYSDHGEAYELDVSHLVHGRSVVDGSQFSIEGEHGGVQRKFVASFRLVDKPISARKAAMGETSDVVSIALAWTGGLAGAVVFGELSRHRGTSFEGGVIDVRTYAERLRNGEGTASAELVASEGLSSERVVALYDAISLTPEELVVLEALQTIEPGIERIALAKLPPSSVARSGIRISINGQRMPIGSMGDGMWRILGIALCLVGVRDGVLLIDEIDTGLHYSVLTKMWRLVLATSRRLGVQVFATTHSRDCVDSLAEVAHDDGQDISLQRIERDKPQAVPFSEAAIRRAAERGIEIR
jgi:energy-coupling factor transporter ATP-binding protein EcfA2